MFDKTLARIALALVLATIPTVVIYFCIFPPEDPAALVSALEALIPLVMGILAAAGIWDRRGRKTAEEVGESQASGTSPERATVEGVGQERPLAEEKS